MKLLLVMLVLVATTCALPARDSAELLKRLREETTIAEEAEQLKREDELMLKRQSDSSTSTADDILRLLKLSAVYNGKTLV